MASVSAIHLENSQYFIDFVYILDNLTGITTEKVLVMQVFIIFIIKV